MKTWFNNLPLAKKLSMLSLLTTISASLFICIIQVYYLWGAVHADLLRRHTTTVEVIVHNSLPALQFEDPVAAKQIIQALERDPDVIGAELFRPDASAFASYRRADSSKLVLHSQFDKISPDFPNRIIPVFNEQYVDLVAAVNFEGQTLGSILMRVDLNSTYRRLIILSLVTALATLSAILFAMWLLRKLLKPIFDPINQLVSTMREVSHNGDYSRRAIATSSDEIGEIAKNFNFMIEQIQLRDMDLSEKLTDRIKAEEQMEHIAHYDSVTGLPNRHYFNRRILELQQQYGGREYRCTLLFVDLDNFKYVNDTFGHSVGDLLLSAVADRFQQTLRANDLVVRLGGDEFAILMENLKSIDTAIKIANKLLKAVSESFNCAGHEINVGASIGIAMMPSHINRIDELLVCADAAMYEAKARGKNNVQVWQSDMSDRTAKRFMIESGLRRAIENKELELFYQPIVNLETGRMAGMEALLRWRHPTIGFISPIEFIPIAEDSQLIVTIGEWVLRQACQQIILWSARFGPLFMAINVSGKQFREPNFACTLDKITNEFGCPPSLIELEVTETTIMTQTPEMQGTVADLMARGFRLSLDDFGTGYSSLSYLKRFPISKLKIDRSFISDLPSDNDDVVIVQAIISLSEHLEMKTIGEGIESTEQADFLRNNKCTYGQGYLYARPMPVADFEVFAAENLAQNVENS